MELIRLTVRRLHLKKRDKLKKEKKKRHIIEIYEDLYAYSPVCVLL
jgi:hypothetical protein